MNAEVETAQQNFTTAYQAAEISTNDKPVLQNLQTFKATITNADNYLDSVKTEMDKLDEMDIRNVELVRSILLFKGVGDTIVAKLGA